MKLIFPNYSECITNLSNSILKHFNLETYHNSLPFIDEILDKGRNKVLVESEKKYKEVKEKVGFTR